MTASTKMTRFTTSWLPARSPASDQTTMDAITLAVSDNTKAVATDNPITIEFDGYNSGRAKAIGEKGLPVVTNLYDTTVIKDSEQSSTDSTKYVVKDAERSGAEVCRRRASG